MDERIGSGERADRHGHAVDLRCERGDVQRRSRLRVRSGRAEHTDLHTVRQYDPADPRRDAADVGATFVEPGGLARDPGAVGPVPRADGDLAAGVVAGDGAGEGGAARVRRARAGRR
jgi:hypothetical protein